MKKKTPCISFPGCLRTYFSCPWDLSWFALRLLNILSVKARLLGNWSLSSILLQECLQFNAALAPADLHVCCFTWKTFEKATQKVTFSNMLRKHGVFNLDQNNQCFCKHFPPKPEKHCKHFYRKLWWKSGLSTRQCLALRQSLSPSPSQSYVQEARNTVTRILQNIAK